MGKINIFKKHGEILNLHVMDNECSSDIKEGFKANNILFQLVPSHMHRRNAVERDIHTLTNYLIAVMCTRNPKLPVNSWDRILPQVATTIKFL